MRSESLLFNNLIIKGPLLLIPELFEDERGFFFESWNKNTFLNLIKQDIEFKQDNHSFSKKGVLRGLHFQYGNMSQGKLVRCIKGEIYDVAVDIRPNSPNFKSWVSSRLSNKNFKQLWIPPGFAHGFLTLSEYAEVVYKTTNYYSKQHERTILWNDPEISINWPIEKSPKLSIKDKRGIFLKEVPINELIL